MSMDTNLVNTVSVYLTLVFRNLGIRSDCICMRSREYWPAKPVSNSARCFEPQRQELYCFDSLEPKSIRRQAC